MNRRNFLGGLAAAIGLGCLLKPSAVNAGQVLKFTKPVTIPINTTVTFTGDAISRIRIGDAVCMTQDGKIKPMKVTRVIPIGGTNIDSWIVDAKY